MATYLPAFRSTWREDIAVMDVGELSRRLRRKTHQTIRRVTEDIERFQFNTAIAAMMELLNDLTAFTPDTETAYDDVNVIWSEAVETLVRLLSPFAPHVACALWEALGMDTDLPFRAVARPRPRRRRRGCTGDPRPGQRQTPRQAPRPHRHR